MKKKQLFIIVGVVLLIISIIIGSIVFSVKIKEKQEQEIIEAWYNSKIEEKIEDFRSYYSDLSFEIDYSVLYYSDGVGVAYYIEGDETIKDYFSKKANKFYHGFSPLVEFGIIENIYIYINGEMFVGYFDWYDAKEDWEQICQYDSCTLSREYGSHYCWIHQSED